MSACKACGKPLRWEKTSTGQLLPIDPDPVPDGNLAVANGRARVVPVEERATCGVPLYKSHFATCPAAEKFRAPLRHSPGRPR